MSHALDNARRRFLVKSATLIGGAGIAMAAVPFIAAMNPSARSRAEGAPVEVDIARLEPGQQITVRWRGRPVWVLRRTAGNLEDLDSGRLRARLRDPDCEEPDQQPDYARNPYRAINPEYLVVVGICTHLGCVPTYRPKRAPADLGSEWVGGYFCPCHGSRFDLAGRVYRGVPAPLNLVVPPHHYLSAVRVLIGADPPAA